MLVSLVCGAAGMRARRFWLSRTGRPDMSSISEDVWVGGVTDIGSAAKSIRNILDMRVEARDDPDEIKRHSINYLNIGVPDGNAPTMPQARQAVKWLEQNSGSGGTLIHCNLGRGRAPCTAAIYLVHEGMRATDAIRTVMDCRRFAYMNQKQLAAVYEFEDANTKRD